MIRLKNAHKGEHAAIIFGGPSLVAQEFDFSALKRQGCVVFLEAKALTPWFLERGVEPDYYFMPFPEKTKDNALQNFVYRGLLAGVNIVPFLKSRWRPMARHLVERFDTYYESWSPHKGAHKRYRLRPEVYLPDSPFALLSRLRKARLVVNRQRMVDHFPGVASAERLHLFEALEPDGEFTLARYFDVDDSSGVAKLHQFSSHTNSAAIALYPLLHYMGFREAYCLGMDMSMLGSMEYAATFTFRSMLAFRWFFYRVRHTFNADYRTNTPYYYRPASEFDDLRRLVGGSELKLTRVYSSWKYAAPVSGVPTVSPQEFLASS